MRLYERTREIITAVLAEAGILEPVAQVDNNLILGPSPDLGTDLGPEIAARCIRAAYSLGYQHALEDEEPFPLTAASEAEREAWARLPVS